MRASSDLPSAWKHLDRLCLQLVSARADTDQWKRRASILFLKVSSAQEDVDMYSMRCQLLEAQILRESSQAKACQACVFML